MIIKADLINKEYVLQDTLYFKDFSEAEQILKLILSNKENDDIDSADIWLNTDDTKECEGGPYLLKTMRRKNKSTEEKQNRDLVKTINSLLETI